jgi:hypothetical protein
MLGMDFMQNFCIIKVMPRRPAKTSKRISRKRQKGFSWKTLVKSSRLQKKIKKSATVALLLILSVSFLGGIWLYKALTKPFASAKSSTSFDINNSDIVSISIASVEDIKQIPVKTKSIHFLIFDKSKKKVVSYEVALDYETDVPGRFGVEPYANVLPLGMMADNDLASGANLLVSALEKDFGFSVDRHIVVDDEVIAPVLSTFVYGTGNGLLDFETLQELALSVNTNVTLSEFYSLFTFVRSLREDRFIVHNSQEKYFEDTDALDEGIRDITFDSPVAVEKASVGVLNGTNMPGVASFASRVIRNVGGHVISADNASKSYEKSVLVVESNDLFVVKEIQKYFDIETVVLKGRGGVNEGISDRVDVTLVLGFDIAERL